MKFFFLNLLLAAASVAFASSEPNSIAYYQGSAWTAAQSYGFSTIQNVATNGQFSWVQGTVAGKTGSYIAYSNGTTMSAPFMPVGMTSVLGIASMYPGYEHQAPDDPKASEIWLLGSNAKGQAVVAACLSGTCQRATTYQNLIASETKVYASEGAGWLIGQTADASCLYQYAALENAKAGGTMNAACLAKGLSTVGYGAAIGGKLFLSMSYPGTTKLIYFRANGQISPPVSAPLGSYTMLADYLNQSPLSAVVMAVGFEGRASVFVGHAWKTKDGGNTWRQIKGASKTFSGDSTTLILPHNGMFAVTSAGQLHLFDAKVTNPKWIVKPSPKLDPFSFESADGTKIYSIDPSDQTPSQVCDITQTTATCDPISGTPDCTGTSYQILMYDGKVAFLCRAPAGVSIYDPVSKTWATTPMKVQSPDSRFSQSANLTNAWVATNVDGKTWVSETSG